MERLFRFRSAGRGQGDEAITVGIPPILAAFRRPIVRRARVPLIGHFSLPGSGVEAGETLASALARELMEEVGAEGEIIGVNRHAEAITYEGDRIRTHCVIASFIVRWTGGEPRLATKATRSNGLIRRRACFR